MLNNVLIIYNTNISQSLIDALFYIGVRGLNTNLLGLNLRATLFLPTELETIDGTIRVQSFVWNNVSINYQINNNVANGLQAIAANYPVDGIILSTFTPVRLSAPSLVPDVRCFPGRMARLAYEAQNAGNDGVLPNGRLGFPADLSDQRFELVTKSGQSAVTQCAQNAVAAEQTYNKNKYHLVSDATQFGTVTAGIVLLGDTFGFTLAYYAELKSYAIANVNVTGNIGVNYAFNTPLADDFYFGIVRNPARVFAIVLPMGLGDSNTQAVANYKNNYNVEQGAWTCIWYSTQWPWADRFIYNGGSAAFSNVWEPLSNGLRDPRTIFENLINGLSVMESFTSPGIKSCPAQTVGFHAGELFTVFGDPLYRPYAVSSPLPVAGPLPYA